MNNLTKELKDLCHRNCKMLMKETKEDAEKNGKTSSFMDWKST